MRNLGKGSLKGKISYVLLGLTLVIGSFFAAVTPALADHGDNRRVVIGNNTYQVEHDGEGPHIMVNGVRYYLDSQNNNRVVSVEGKTYTVSGRDHDNHDHHDRHHDHHDDDDD